MMTIAAIAGPRLISCFSTTGDVAVDGEKRFPGKPMRAGALKRVEFRHFGRMLPELHVVSTSFCARASPSPSLRFRVAALPEVLLVSCFYYPLPLQGCVNFETRGVENFK